MESPLEVRVAALNAAVYSLTVHASGAVSHPPRPTSRSVIALAQVYEAYIKTGC